MSVDQPARIEITAALRYREGGVGRQVDLGTYAQDNPGQSTLRLALPERLQNRLDVGRRVRVLLDVTTTPTSKPGCATATTEQIKFRSRLVRLRRTTAPVGTR